MVDVLLLEPGVTAQGGNPSIPNLEQRLNKKVIRKSLQKILVTNFGKSQVNEQIRNSRHS